MPKESVPTRLGALKYEEIKFLYGPRITPIGKLWGHESLMIAYTALRLELEIEKKLTYEELCLF